MGKVYFIGGSPCSGKSTVTEALAQKRNLFYFKVDEKLDDYIGRAAAEHKKACTAVNRMSPEQIWMRDPEEQNREELLIYEEIFEYIIQDMKSITEERDLITEGAAYLPNLMKQQGIQSNHYLSMIPEREFQISHYRKREWVPFVLEGCSDKEKAFENWMNRDCLFAEEVNRRCAEAGYTCLRNDGSESIESLITRVDSYFWGKEPIHQI